MKAPIFHFSVSNESFLKSPVDKFLFESSWPYVIQYVFIYKAFWCLVEQLRWYVPVVKFKNQWGPRRSCRRFSDLYDYEIRLLVNRVQKNPDYRCTEKEKMLLSLPYLTSFQIAAKPAHLC